MRIIFARKRDTPAWKRLLDWMVFGATFTAVLGATIIVVGMVLVTIEMSNQIVDIYEARVILPIFFTPYLFVFPLAPAVEAGAIIGLIAWWLERRWGTLTPQVRKASGIEP